MSKRNKREPRYDVPNHLLQDNPAPPASKRPPLPEGCIPALARPGMLCRTSIDVAKIEAMTPEIAVVRYANGSADALAWEEIELVGVRPDPDCIAK
jgi:hypothetical protein